MNHYTIKPGLSTEKLTELSAQKFTEISDDLSTEIESDFCKGLVGLNRILEAPYYRIWGCSPIWGEDGKVHMYYARWIHKYAKPIGWLISAEIAHAVSDSPEGPFEFVETILEGRGGDHWDSWAVSNPSIYKHGDQYILLYMGTNGSNTGITRDKFLDQPEEVQEEIKQKLLRTKRIGMAISNSVNGPWTRISDEKPLIEAGPKGSWDEVCNTNPAMIITPQGQYYLYYKGWQEGTVTNRKYGIAIADKLEGPYKKYEGNPVIDFSYLAPWIQCEDAYMWYENGTYKSIMRGMGVFGSLEDGVYLTSKDGIHWNDHSPQLAYKRSYEYFPEEAEPLFRPIKGRFERPQILFNPDTGKPDYLYCSLRGGLYNSASGVVLKINL